jgi:hypothetical protein
MPIKDMKDAEMRLLKNVCNDLLVKQNYSLKKEERSKMTDPSRIRSVSVIQWTGKEVSEWAEEQHFSLNLVYCLKNEGFDGRILLTLNENDLRELRDKYNYDLKLADIKRLWLAIRSIQKDNHASLVYLGIVPANESTAHHHHHMPSTNSSHYGNASEIHEFGRISPAMSIDGRATFIQPEFFKTMISLGE